METIDAAAAAALCLLVFHAPDGSQLLIDSASIKVIRPVDASIRAHVAPHTNSIIYTGIRAAGFGVSETPAEAAKMISDCDNPRKQE